MSSIINDVLSSDKKKRAIELSMSYRMAANDLYHKAALYYKQGKGYDGDVHFHFHLAEDGTTHTSSGRHSEAELAEMQNSALRERIEYLEDRILESEDMELIPVIEELSG